MREITVLLPAHNEETTIGGMLDGIKALPSECDVIVADSGCTDRTPVIARNKGALVIKCKRGKGNAVREAIRHVQTPYVVMMDSDGTYPIKAIPAFCDMLSEFDVVKGNRVRCEDGSMPYLNKLGNHAVSLAASALFMRRVRDVDSGMWAFRTERLKSFNLTSERFTLEVDLFTNTIRNKCSLLELPIRYGKRASGSKAKIRLLDWLEIGWFLFKKRFGICEWLWIFSAVLMIDGIWSIACQFDEPFVPYQAGRLIRIGISVCVGIIAYHLGRKQYAHSVNS